MRRYTNAITVSILIAAMCAGCMKDAEKGGDKPEAPKVNSSDEPVLSFVGTVLSTTNVGRYTYLEINTDDVAGDSVWVAALRVESKPGDTVSVAQSILMVDFYSPTLKRTFKNIFFTGTVMQGDVINQPAQQCPVEADQMSGGMGKFYAIGTNSPHANPHGNPHVNPHGDSKGSYHDVNGMPDDKK